MLIVMNPDATETDIRRVVETIESYEFKAPEAGFDPHSIHEGAGRTRHLYGLLTRYLNEKLQAGPQAE